MNFTWFLIFLLQFDQILSTSGKKEESFTEGNRFKAISCKADNITVLTKYCYIKAVSRKVATLNIGVKLLKPITKPIYVRQICSYRYGTISREVIDTKPVEWCGAMEGDKINLLLKQAINQMQSSAPSLYHKCPYDENDIDIQNATLDRSKGMAVFNTGIYTFNTTVTKRGNVIYQFTVIIEIKSAIKESFGRK